VFSDDLGAEIDALVADVRAAVLGRDEHFDLLSALPAKRAREISFRYWVCMHAISLACAPDQAHSRACWASPICGPSSSRSQLASRHAVVAQPGHRLIVGRRSPLPLYAADRIRPHGPWTASLSGKPRRPSSFRIWALSCWRWSAGVRWRPPLSPAIVTQLVTHLRDTSPDLLFHRKLRAHRPPVTALLTSSNDCHRCALLVGAEHRGMARIRPARSTGSIWPAINHWSGSGCMFAVVADRPDEVSKNSTPVMPRSANKLGTRNRVIAYTLGVAGLGAGGVAVFLTHVEAGPVALLAVGLIFMIVALSGRIPSRLKIGENEAEWQDAAGEVIETAVEGIVPKRKSSDRHSTRPTRRGRSPSCRPGIVNRCL
jgi:hypothetical protein